MSVLHSIIHTGTSVLYFDFSGDGLLLSFDLLLHFLLPFCIEVLKLCVHLLSFLVDLLDCLGNNHSSDIGNSVAGLCGLSFGESLRVIRILYQRHLLFEIISLAT